MNVSFWITFIPSLISLAILVAVIIFANYKLRYVESEEKRYSRRRITEESEIGDIWGGGGVFPEQGIEIASGPTLADAKRVSEIAIKQAAEMRAVVEELRRLQAAPVNWGQLVLAQVVRDIETDLSAGREAIVQGEFEEAREHSRMALRRRANLSTTIEELEAKQQEAQRLLKEIDERERQACHPSVV